MESGTTQPCRRSSLPTRVRTRTITGLLQILLEDLDCRPAGHLARTAPVLVAADIEPGIVFFGEAVLADVNRPSDFHDGAEFEMLRAGDRIAATADVGTRSCRTRIAVSLPGNRIVTRYIRPDFFKARRGFRFSGRGQGKRQQQRRGFQHPKYPVIVENSKRLVTGVVGYLSNVSR